MSSSSARTKKLTQLRSIRASVDLEMDALLNYVYEAIKVLAGRGQNSRPPERCVVIVCANNGVISCICLNSYVRGGMYLSW